MIRHPPAVPYFPWPQALCCDQQRREGGSKDPSEKIRLGVGGVISLCSPSTVTVARQCGPSVRLGGSDLCSAVQELPLIVTL